MRRRWRAQHVIVGDAGVYMFPVYVLFRINCSCCTEKAGRFGFRKWKYNKLTNRTIVAIVTRVIILAVMFNIVATKTLADVNVFSRRR